MEFLVFGIIAIAGVVFLSALVDVLTRIADTLDRIEKRMGPSAGQEIR